LDKRRQGDKEARRQGETHNDSSPCPPVSLSPRLGVSLWRRISVGYFTVVAAVFVLTTIAVALHSASGLVIAGCFVVALLAVSVISRAYRADELRTVGFEFKDAQSRFLWDSMRLADFPIMVPHRPGHKEREIKEERIRKHH